MNKPTAATAAALLALVAFSVPSPARASNNLHLIERLPNGFEIYRTSKPDRDDMRELCRRGVTEIVVLSGNAESYEYKYAEECPQLKVVYNRVQDDEVALSSGFLQTFTDWVETARASGKKIAFRCNCGCHRTGRLAAYYQMKWQNMTGHDAIELLHAYGRNMWLHPWLDKQVWGLHAYVHGNDCRLKPKYCVTDGPDLSPAP